MACSMFSQFSPWRVLYTLAATLILTRRRVEASILIFTPLGVWEKATTLTVVILTWLMWWETAKNKNRILLDKFGFHFHFVPPSQITLNFEHISLLLVYYELEGLYKVKAERFCWAMPIKLFSNLEALETLDLVFIVHIGDLVQLSL